MSHSGSRLGAGAVALAVSISMVPTVAMASGTTAARGMMTAPGGSGYAAVVPEAWNHALLLAKKKKKKKKKKPAGITPEGAESKRQAIRDAVASDVEAENWEAAADETEANAAMLGDPVSYQEAAEYRLKQAEEDRDVDAAEAAIETATIALDIFNFYDSVDSGDAASQWLVIDPSEAASSASDVEDLIEQAESLIEEIESEDDEDDEDDGDDGKAKKERKKKKGAKPGTVLIALGAAFTAVGVAGAAVGIAGAVASRRADDEVNELMLPADQAEVDRLDEEGSRANRLGFIGVGMAGAGLAIGVPLLIVGILRRKKGGSGSSARYRVVPAMTARYGGVAFHGRF